MRHMGATEDAASGRPARGDGSRLHFETSSKSRSKATSRSQAASISKGDETIRRAVLGKRAFALLVTLGLLAAGCASSDEETATPAPSATAPPAAVPPAKTQSVWIDRLVKRFLIDMNENLAVVTSLGRHEVQIYLRTGNETTISVLRTRMADLSKCSRKLARVGAPPARSGPLARIYENLQQACPHYERLAEAVLTSIPLISSGDADEVAKGEAVLAKASEPSREAARYYGAAADLLQRKGLLRAYQR
jgi:hypothetical protein